MLATITIKGHKTPYHIACIKMKKYRKRISSFHYNIHFQLLFKDIMYNSNVNVNIFAIFCPILQSHAIVSLGIFKTIFIINDTSKNTNDSFCTCYYQRPNYNAYAILILHLKKCSIFQC